MYYSELYPYDMVNGEGVRLSIFLSGCDHQCKGCFNKKTWKRDFGQPFTDKTVDYILKELQDTRRIRDGLSLIGGDPLFRDNVTDVISLCQTVKANTNKNIWLWTGYTLEEIQSDLIRCQILDYVDVIIDGKFVEDLKDLKLKFRGSSNQRILRKGIDF